MSPYNYGVNNPIRFIEPDGMGIIEEATARDAQKEKQDLDKTFANANFEKFRGLITIASDGKTFNKVDAGALPTALNGANLSADDKVLVNQVTGALNSAKVHKVEFADISGNISTLNPLSYPLLGGIRTNYKRGSILLWATKNNVERC